MQRLGPGTCLDLVPETKSLNRFPGAQFLGVQEFCPPSAIICTTVEGVVPETKLVFKS